MKTDHRYIIGIALLLYTTPAASFFYRYKQDSIVIYSLCGFHWGWDNNKQILGDDLDFLVERFEAERKENAERARQKKSQKGTKEKNTMSTHATHTTDELYALLGITPPYMIYTEQQKFWLGLKSKTDRWFFHVSWHDDKSPLALSIINETGETLFVEPNEQPFVMAPKRLKGVHNGHVRRLAMMDHQVLTIWRMQLNQESLDHLVTIVKVPAGTSLVRLGKQQEKITVQCIDESDDEDTV